MEKKEDKKELIVSSDYYSSSYIVNQHYLVTIKRYAADNSLMIVDTTRVDEQITTPLLAAIYRNLSRPDTDALLITNYSQKANKVTLLEIDTNSLLDRNELALKIDNQVFNITQKNKENEEQKEKKKTNLHPDQSRRIKTVKDVECHLKLCKNKSADDHCLLVHPIFDQSGDCANYTPITHEMSASDNTERR